MTLSFLAAAPVLPRAAHAACAARVLRLPLRRARTPLAPAPPRAMPSALLRRLFARLAPRDAPIPAPRAHAVLNTPMQPPEHAWPAPLQSATFALGCFWGAERKFWTAPAVYTTSVGYAGGRTPNPTYRDVCSGRTGHAEVVNVVFDSTKTSYEQMLDIFWDAHDPTTRNRQGNDVGTQYRSAIYYYNDEQKKLAEKTRDHFNALLKEAGRNPCTTEIAPAGKYYFAEEYHQQYLHKNPNGYCGLGGTGLYRPRQKASTE